MMRREIMEQIVKIDSAGGISLPRDVVAALDLREEDRLMVTSGPDAIVIKKVSAGTLEERFRSLADRVARQFEEKKIAKEDVAEAVAWSRK
jgi:bifunctional DNA-binding transcriptional regulator/antitoxin component of YhaV-PrlF toxin-antitoxin module